MKIGDEVYIHGYVDEIRKDVIIIRNEGGYFGTIPKEILQLPKRMLSVDLIIETLSLDLPRTRQAFQHDR